MLSVDVTFNLGWQREPSRFEMCSEPLWDLICYRFSASPLGNRDLVSFALGNVIKRKKQLASEKPWEHSCSL